MALAPVLRIDSATRLAAPSFQSRMATVLPSSARRRAAASPIPEPAPVIAATLPFNPRIILTLPSRTALGCSLAALLLDKG